VPDEHHVEHEKSDGEGHGNPLKKSVIAALNGRLPLGRQRNWGGSGLFGLNPDGVAGHTMSCGPCEGRSSRTDNPTDR
jgi:hypothetical protein